MAASDARPLAVVTGASSGIGLALAAKFGLEGFDLLIVAENERIAAAAEGLEAETGARVRAVQADLRTYQGVEDLYGEITKAGPVDAIALNAGIGLGGPFSTGPDLESQLDVVRLNVVSQVHLARRVLPDLVAKGSGRVLFTSSIAATQPGPYEAVYAASKAFVFSFAEALRTELDGTGVTVTALMPGPTDTEFFDRAGMEDTRIGAGPKDAAADVAKEGYDALMAGRDHVVAGSTRNSLMTGLSKVLPESAKAATHQKLSEPGSA